LTPSGGSIGAEKSLPRGQFARVRETMLLMSRRLLLPQKGHESTVLAPPAFCFPVAMAAAQVTRPQVRTDRTSSAHARARLTAC
jgi:hypothetical protein